MATDLDLDHDLFVLLDTDTVPVPVIKQGVLGGFWALKRRRLVFLGERENVTPDVAVFWLSVERT